MRLRIFVAVGVAAMSASLLAQAPAERLAFEAASIKVDHSANAVQTFQHAPGGRFTASSVSVRLLMEYAFDVNRSRISGAPSWLSSDRFDIAATAGEDVAVADFQKLVQTLLCDRFRLAYHWQTEQRDIYELVMNKTGKLTASEPGDCDPHDVNDLPCGGMLNTPGHTGGRKLTGDDLAASLSFFLNTRVINRTGLVGRYDVRLDWAADASDTTASSIFTAVQEQLGLKLEPTKGQVDVLVIDHVEHPTED